jgi:hypothetical protein
LCPGVDYRLTAVLTDRLRRCRRWKPQRGERGVRYHRD